MTVSQGDFDRLPDLASRALGAGILGTNDDFFADVHSLIDPREAHHDPTAYGPRGKSYDGWETRRRRSAGEDYAVVRLAVPAVIRGVDIDTRFFRGNYPPHASVQATTLLGYPDLDEVLGAEWVTLIDRAPLVGHSNNLVAVSEPGRLATHLRLVMHPDGGIARFRAYGEVVPDPRLLGGRIDLAALTRGGDVDSCSNMFYSSPANVLSPGRATVMSDGWETSRRRDADNDWLVVALAAPGVLHEAIIDTSRFVGNSPGWAALSDADTGHALLPRTRLIPDTEHRLLLAAAPVARRVRLDIYPDGGISRLRLRGTVPDQLHESIARRWLGLLPEAVAQTVEPAQFFG